MVNDEQRSPLFLALDCGEIPLEEVPNYERAPAYLRAKAVWQAIYNQVMGQGGYISTRTMINYGHAYCVAYAESVPYMVQRQVFHIMDRYRQKYHTTFVQLPKRVVQDLFDARTKAIKEKNPVAYSISSTDVGELYETHQPRVMTRDAQEPIPIDPPFQSIPLYYQKETGQEAQPRTSNKKSFLERYLTVLRLDYEREVAEAQKKQMSPDIVQKLSSVGQAMLVSGLSARKYRFTPSAMAMCHTLLQGIGGKGTTIRDLPGQAMLIEFVETIEMQLPHVDPVAGLFFMQPFREWYQWVAQDRERRARVFGTHSTDDLPTLWTLNVLAEEGASIFNLIYDSNRQAWRVPEIRECLSGRCKQLMSPEEMLARGAFTNWELCSECQQMLDYFSRFLPITLLMVAGEFAEEAEPMEREIVETITHKEKRPGSGKYDERREQVQFRIVSFDACFHRPSHQGEKREPGQGPTWMELALKEGALTHVKRGFGKSTRHLDPARNSRWKAKRDVTVRGYEKRIPMRVENLQRLITKVVASKYEEKKETL